MRVGARFAALTFAVGACSPHADRGDLAGDRRVEVLVSYATSSRLAVVTPFPGQ